MHERGVRIEPRLLAKFEVPGEPVPKARPRLGPRGNTYTPVKTRDAENRVRDHLFVSNPRLRPVEGLVGLKMHFYLGGLGRADLDNLIKLILDSLNQALFADDSQVVKLEAELTTFDSRPRSEIEAWLLAVPENRQLSAL